VYSYLTIQDADYDCDQPIYLTSQTFLVLINLRIIPKANFPPNALGVIIAQNAQFSGVITPGGTPKAGSSFYAGIDCLYLPNGGPSGIYVSNSSYFIIDGITINACGGGTIQTLNGPTMLGGVTFVGQNSLGIKITAGVPTAGAPYQSTLLGNSTQIANSVIQNSIGPGLLVYLGTRAILHKTTVANSGTCGVYLLSSSRTIVTSSLITNSNAEGILSDWGSMLAVVAGNTISLNTVGVRIANSNMNGSAFGYTTAISWNNILIRNTITGNDNSIILSSNFSGGLYGNMITQNTLSGNSIGLAIAGAPNGVQRTAYYTNADSDGLTNSFLSFVPGATSFVANGGFKNGYVDPANRLFFLNF